MGVGTIQAGGKLLLAFALLWFYCWWSKFLTYWDGRTPGKRWLLGLLMFGPYLVLFLPAFTMALLLPTVLLLWNPVRNGVGGVALAAGLTPIGILFDRVRLFGTAWTAPLLAGHEAVSEGRVVPPPLAVEVAQLPSPYWPGPLDLLILAGCVAAVGLLCLLALRWAPPLALWESRWAERLVVERELLGVEVDVVGRPR